jgi:hypothetical protein
MKGIKIAGYMNPNIKDDPFEGLDKEKKEEFMLNAVKTFSSKYRKELLAVVRILIFLTKYSDKYSDVLPVLNEAIPFQKLEWTAKRFELAEKLNEINKKLDTDARRGSPKERAAITKKEDLIRFSIMREIESHLRKYKYVYRPLLKKHVEKKYGDSQYLKSLRLNVDEELTLYIYAMGITEGAISWKKSSKNETKFDRLWQDAGRTGKPQMKTGFRVYGCKLCSPSEMAKNYFKNI